MKRNRVGYALALAGVIVMGLGVRKFHQYFALWFSKDAGDALYAVAAYLVIAIRFPTLSVSRTALIALIYSYCIEFSQLYHAPWIEAIRHTKLGGLILGYGFSWKDMACYTVGVAVIAAIELVLVPRKRNDALA